jgi:FkbM family methyltransferase
MKNKRLSKILHCFSFQKKCSVDYTPVKILSVEENIVTAEVHGFIWKLDKTRYLDNQILKHGVFEKESKELIEDLVHPGMVVADIGANFGYYTLPMSKLVGPQGYVYAFEPVDRYRHRLLEHIKLNNIINVEVSNYALSNASGHGQINIGECSGTFHWCAPQKPEFTQKVILTTLDTYIEKREINKLDFIKVDLDGHETFFLEGAKNTLLKYKPIVLIESSQMNLHEAGSAAWELVDMIEDLNYTLISAKSRKIFPSRLDCLKEVANFSHSADILCIPSCHKLLELFGSTPAVRRTGDPQHTS